MPLETALTRRAAGLFSYHALLSWIWCPEGQNYTANSPCGARRSAGSCCLLPASVEFSSCAGCSTCFLTVTCGSEVCGVKLLIPRCRGRMHTWKGRWRLGCIPGCSSHFINMLLLFRMTAEIFINAIKTINPSTSQWDLFQWGPFTGSLLASSLAVGAHLSQVSHSLASYGWHIRFLPVYCSGR